MAVYVRDIAREVVGSVGDDDSLVIACAKWIDSRYQELTSRCRMRFLREVGEVAVPGRIEDGTATATRGSTSVTGSGAAWQTDIGSGAVEGWFFRTRTAWYRISTIDGENALTLESEFAEATTSGAEYRIVRREIPLATDARWVSDFMHQRSAIVLTVMSLEELDRRAPGRFLYAGLPDSCAQVGVNSGGAPLFEFYPYPKQNEIVQYVYHKKPTALAIDDAIPEQVDAYVLKEGALVDFYRYMKTRLIGEGNAEGAVMYRNDEHAQRTVWERKIAEAIKTSSTVSDRVFLLRWRNDRGYKDITTAQEQVWATGNRP